MRFQWAVRAVDVLPMRICRNMTPVLQEPFANSNRKYGRVRCRQIGCSLGDVLDLSAGGMRVGSRGSMGLREGDTVGVTLGANQAPIPLRCRVVWRRKVSWRSWEMGMTFLEPTAETREALNHVARGVTFQGQLSPSGRDV
jgi:hypothetical protein